MSDYIDSDKQEDEGIGCGTYIVAMLSFIPLIGVPFGIAAIILGALKMDKGGWKAVILGFLGIAFTALCAILVVPMMVAKFQTFYEEYRPTISQQGMSVLIPDIEDYKNKNGEYPERLEVLNPEDPADAQSMIFDMGLLKFDDMTTFPLYHYKVVNDGANYHLLSVGDDLIAYTDDDLHPDLTMTSTEAVGYVGPALEVSGSDAPTTGSLSPVAVE